MPKITKFTANF